MPMTRNASCRALVLRTRASGESNREAWLLCERTGIVRVTVFGGPKSRLRAYASPFHSGRAWTYHDPVKDSRKLTDFDVDRWRPGIREMYERAMAADAIARVALASHGGGGNWGDALSLTEAALDAAEGADEETCPRVVPWFLWRWADFLGLRPDLASCPLCGRPAAQGAPLWFSPREGGAVCAACKNAVDARGGLVEIGPGARLWLETALSLPHDRLASHAADGASLREAGALAKAALADALGGFSLRSNF